MTIEEYRQLRTYSRYDGFYLGVIWTASFACLIGMSAFPSLSMLSLAIALTTPFFVGMQLKKYRDEGLGGKLPFRRGLIYCFRVFLNAALFFAVVQWAYMQFVDNGRLAGMLNTMMMQDDARVILQQAGINAEEVVEAFAGISPLQFALTYFVENVVIGIILSFPISAVMKKG
jgi:hypothetical protein